MRRRYAGDEKIGRIGGGDHGFAVDYDGLAVADGDTGKTRGACCFHGARSNRWQIDPKFLSGLGEFHEHGVRRPVARGFAGEVPVTAEAPAD